MFIQIFEMQRLSKIVDFSMQCNVESNIVSILECMEWYNGSQLAVHRQRWPAAITSTFTHDGYNWV